MEALKNQIQKSFRMEMIGTGLYDALAKQYGRKDQKLGKRLQTFSNDERMHGRLFQKRSQNLFGTPPPGRSSLAIRRENGRLGHAPPPSGGQAQKTEHRGKTSR